MEAGFVRVGILGGVIGLLIAAAVALNSSPDVSAAGGVQKGSVTGTSFAPDADRTKPKKGNVRCLSFSPDGKYLVTCLGENNVKLWELGDSSPKEKLKLDHGGPLGGAVFSPDGKRLATYGPEAGLKLWDVANGKLVASSQEARFESATFSPDGRLLVAGDTQQKTFTQDAKLWFLDPASAKLVRKTEVKQYSTGAVIVVDQGRKVVHTDPASTSSIVVRDFEKGTVVKKLEGHSAGAQVRASQDGRYFISVAKHFEKEMEVFVWDSASLDRVLALKFPHAGGRLPSEADITTDNRYVLVLVDLKTDASSQTSQLQVYDRATGTLIRSSVELNAEGTALAVSPDGKTVAVGGRRLVGPGNLEGTVVLFKTAALVGE